MIVEKPYHIQINNKWQAYNAIANMCANCPELLLCKDTSRCNNIKDKIRIAFMSIKR